MKLSIVKSLKANSFSKTALPSRVHHKKFPKTMFGEAKVFDFSILKVCYFVYFF